MLWAPWPQPLGRRSLMLKASIALFFVLSTFALTQDPVNEQDPVDEPAPQEEIDGLDGLLAPFTAYREEEQKRKSEMLSGAWRLARLETATDRLGVRDIQGFAMFRDGYASVVFMGQQIVEGFLTIDNLEITIQAGIYRYQVSDLGTLQTASLMGFSNPDASNLVFEQADEPREFEMDVSEHELRLSHPNGHLFVYTRMQSAIFPEEALRALERDRAGRDTTPDWNSD
jgi:hypothetical protein